MTEELFDVLDENGNITGIRKTKKEIHERGLWHQSVHIWIYNSKGEILLQKKSKNKDSWSGMWDISVAGHISAGETPEHAVIREAEEELGIKVSLSQLKKLGIRKSERDFNEINFHNKGFDYVYLLKFDGNIKKLKLNGKEVEKVKFFSPKQLEKELNDKELSKLYVPHKGYYLDIINTVKKELTE
jgi:isopentenyl-diphosphate delta-isomerase